MIRERTSLNLIVGLLFSLLLHVYVVIWGPSISLPTANLQSTSEVEVQLREWPASPAAPLPAETIRIEEPPLPAPTPAQPAKPSLPPNTQALQEAVQTDLSQVRPERVEVQLPEALAPLPTPDSPLDPVHLPPALWDPSQTALRITDSPALPTLPVPERARAEPKDAPALPRLERPTRRHTASERLATTTLPTPGSTSAIIGPAAERRVIFQPPPPHAIVESESELELRFWILPNGAVGRVVPVKKADPRLEALAINYLRHWRFNPLPSEAPQDEQWGVIPFRFRNR
jgi:TonB family protein